MNRVEPAALTLVRAVEDWRAAPYDDNGAAPGGTWSIGYGATRDLAGRAITSATPPITEAVGLLLLARDMTEAARAVEALVRVSLAPSERAALQSFVFNLGRPALARSTLLRRLNAGQFGAVPEELRRWHFQGTTPLLGLLRRRWMEAALWRGWDPQAAYQAGMTRLRQLTDWPPLTPMESADGRPG